MNKTLNNNFCTSSVKFLFLRYEIDRIYCQALSVSRKHISLISTLTMISVAGVTLGTALLIIVLSVFNGFFEVIKGHLLKNEPGIRIEAANTQPFTYSQQMQEKLKTIPQIKAASPYITGKSLLTVTRDRNHVVTVKGVRIQPFTKIKHLKGSIVEGMVDLSVRNGQPGMLISRLLASRLGLSVGSVVALLSASGMRHALTQFSLPRVYRFQVTGIYKTTEIVSSAPVFIDMRAARHLFEMRRGVSGVDLRLYHTNQANEVKAKLQNSLKSNYQISTWYDLKKPIYDVMHLEKWGSYIILMIIVLVAVLNIIGSLSMIVIQKNGISAYC